MSRQARIEDGSDSETSEPAEMELDQVPFGAFPLRPASTSTSATATTSAPAPLRRHPSGALPSSASASASLEPLSAANAPDFRRHQCLYPLYFDAGRTRAEGRRVAQAQAVANPLARDIVDAVQALGLAGAQTLFEPGKTHPRDWANPGRVKVLVKREGRPVTGRVKNKRHLYTLVAAHLRAHPTTTASPLRLAPHDPSRMPAPPATSRDPHTAKAESVPGLPPPAIPRGWKMGAILPLHSPAVSGGGVSENLLGDMMAQIQGLQGGPGGTRPGAGPGDRALGGGGSEREMKRREKRKK
ncbi:MAG: signal recognition particle subunit [Phylliscum demangeonii]|nr:MAG: signal recognition particle subunit [Phylliscum demangeonii]